MVRRGHSCTPWRHRTCPHWRKNKQNTDFKLRMATEHLGVKSMIVPYILKAKPHLFKAKGLSHNYGSAGISDPVASYVKGWKDFFNTSKRCPCWQLLILSLGTGKMEKKNSEMKPCPLMVYLVDTVVPLYPRGDMFQDAPSGCVKPQSRKPYIYCFLLYIHNLST